MFYSSYKTAVWEIPEEFFIPFGCVLRSRDWLREAAESTRYEVCSKASSLGSGKGDQTSIRGMVTLCGEYH